MRKSIVLCIVGACLLLLSGVNPAQASLSLLGNKLTLSGFLKNETAYNPNHDREFMKIENTFQLEAEYKFPGLFMKRYFILINEQGFSEV